MAGARSRWWYRQLTKAAVAGNRVAATLRGMSRADLPARGVPPNARRFRWFLHSAVLLLAIAAVVVAVRERVTGDSASDPGGAGPAETAVAVVQTPLPTEIATAAPSPSPSPTPEPTPTPTPEPSPSPTPAPTPEPTPAPTPAPTPTPAPPPPPTPQPAVAPVRTPVPTPRPPPVTARALGTASLRSAPSADSLITGYVPAGSVVTVVGCSGGCSWLLVAGTGGTAWSARHFWSVTGDLSTIGVR